MKKFDFCGQIITTTMATNPEQRDIPALKTIIESHLLQEDLSCLAILCLGKYEILDQNKGISQSLIFLFRIADTKEHAKAVVDQGGADQMFEVLQRCMGGSDQNIEYALESICAVAMSTGTANFVRPEHIELLNEVMFDPLIKNFDLVLLQTLIKHASPAVVTAGTKTLALLCDDVLFAVEYVQTQGYVEATESLDLYVLCYIIKKSLMFYFQVH